MESTPCTPTEKRSPLDRLAALFPLPRQGERRDASYLIWTFLLPFSLMLLVYVMDGVWPFGGRSVLVLDLNGQYVGFFEALRGFAHGDGSMLYSFSRSLGGEMMGIYAYYLASPLSYIVALFPADMMTEALFFLFVLKAGLAGLTFGWYAHKRHLSNSYTTVAFSCLYALCSFAIVMQNNTMWMDNLILLPLLTMGIEELVRNRRYRLYVTSLALSLLANFYIGYMCCIYTMVYFLYCFYAYGSRRRNPLREGGQYGRALLRMAVYSALAIGIAAIIILGASYSLSFGKNEFSNPNFTPELRFDPLSFFVKMLPGAYDTVEPEGLPTVFCGTLVLFLVPLYLFNRRIERRERIASLVLLAVFYVSMSVSTLDILWHGGQAPNWLNYRYSFMFCFLLLVMSMRGLRRLSDLSRVQIGVTVALPAALVLLALLLKNGALDPFCEASDAAWSPWAVLFSLVTIALFGALLFLWKLSPEGRRGLLSLCLLLVVVAEVLLNGILQITALHVNVGATDRQSYVSYQKTTGQAVEWVKTNRPGFYRMETDYHRVVNDTMELGFRGVTNSTSTLNAKTLTFLSSLGLLADSHWSEYKGSTLTLDSLLGIRYLVTGAFSRPISAYTSVIDLASNSVYENPYALSLAFAASAAANGYTADAYPNPFERQSALVAALRGGVKSELYTSLLYATRVENATDSHKDYAEQEVAYYEVLSNVYNENKDALESGEMDITGMSAPDATITFTVTMPKDGQLYFYVPTDYQNEVGVYVNGGYHSDYNSHNGDYIKSVGYFSTGESVEVTLKMEGCIWFAFPYDAKLFYVQNDEAIAEAMDDLSLGNATFGNCYDDHIVGRVTTTEGRNILFTTIPYDAGWRVTVDGREVGTYMTADALLAVDLSAFAAGEHSFEMVYAPDCYLVGRVVSITALCIFLLLVTVEKLWRRGILRVREGGVLDRAMSVFMYRGEVGEEPDYLSDEEIERAEARREERRRRREAARAEAEAKNKADGEERISDTGGANDE